MSEGDLTYDKALKIAQAMELAERDARELQQAGAHSRAGVHRTRAQNLVTGVSTQYQGQATELPLIVVARDGPSPLG